VVPNTENFQTPGPQRSWSTLVLLQQCNTLAFFNNLYYNQELTSMGKGKQIIWK
jgi:hypothetical protein